MPTRLLHTEMYPFWMNVMDADAIRFLVFTFLSLELKVSMAQLSSSTRSSETKILAREVVTLVPWRRSLKKACFITLGLGNIKNLSVKKSCKQGLRGVPSIRYKPTKTLTSWKSSCHLVWSTQGNISPRRCTNGAIYVNVGTSRTWTMFGWRRRIRERNSPLSAVRSRKYFVTYINLFKALSTQTKELLFPENNSFCLWLIKITLHIYS